MSVRLCAAAAKRKEEGEVGASASGHWSVRLCAAAANSLKVDLDRLLGDAAKWGEEEEEEVMGLSAGKGMRVLFVRRWAA